MSTRPRSLLILPLALALAACAQPGPTTTSAPSTENSPSPAESASEEPAGSSAPEADQTDTDWGRIWDTVPAGFPHYPGSTPADDASAEPASARYAVSNGDPATIATWLQDALETATFSTLGLNGPGEDGGYVIDSTGGGDCMVQTRIAPLGDITFITVLYGAACPAG
jgi:hypothetical protein